MCYSLLCSMLILFEFTRIGPSTLLSITKLRQENVPCSPTKFNVGILKRDENPSVLISNWFFFDASVEKHSTISQRWHLNIWTWTSLLLTGLRRNKMLRSPSEDGALCEKRDVELFSVNFFLDIVDTIRTEDTVFVCFNSEILFILQMNQ